MTRSERGSVTGGLLVGALWVGAIVAVVGMVWTLPGTGDVRAWRWLGTAIVFLVATFVTAVVALP